MEDRIHMHLQLPAVCISKTKFRKAQLPNALPDRLSCTSTARIVMDTLLQPQVFIGGLLIALIGGAVLAFNQPPLPLLAEVKDIALTFGWSSCTHDDVWVEQVHGGVWCLPFELFRLESASIDCEWMDQ